MTRTTSSMSQQTQFIQSRRTLPMATSEQLSKRTGQLQCIKEAYDMYIREMNREEGTILPTIPPMAPHGEFLHGDNEKQQCNPL